MKITWLCFPYVVDKDRLATDPTQYQVLEDNKILGDYGVNPQTARPQLPVTIALATRDSAGNFQLVTKSHLAVNVSEILLPLLLVA